MKKFQATLSTLAESLDSIPKTFLIGVSGGVDSCALLHQLVALGKLPIVLHFNHRWRAESNDDALFVKRLAKEKNLSFYLGRATKNSKQTEGNARVERWKFFQKIATKTKCFHLVLAHHADDQVETFLLQLLRGSGSGLQGMQSNTTHGDLKVYRPWLSVWRKEIVAYARHHQLEWREDQTNRNPQFLRNRIRHRLLPYLRKNFSPQINSILWRATEIRSGEMKWLDQLCKEDAQQNHLNLKVLRQMPLGQVRNTIRLWLLDHQISDVGFLEIENVRLLIQNRFPAKVNLSAGKFVRRRAGILFIE